MTDSFLDNSLDLPKPPAPSVVPWPAPVPPFTYLAGAAGVGKTFITKLWAEEDPGVLLLSTTGIAAINLGGTTINAALGYFDTKSLQDKFVSGQLGAQLGRLYRSGVRRLIVDECFDYKQPILTERGWLRIGDIVKRKLSVRVASVCEGRIEWQPVVGWLRKRHEGTTVLRVDASRTGSRRGARIIKCTPNHPIKTPGGYTEAGKLRVGDVIYVRGPHLSPVQRSLVLGSLLGDAHLSFGKHGRQSPQVVFTQGEAQLDYLQVKQRILGSLAGRMRKAKSGYKPENNIYQLPMAVVDELFDIAREMTQHGRYWSPTAHFINQIDVAALAFWFADDGSVGRNKTGQITGATIHLAPFNEEARTTLQQHLLTTFGLVAAVRQTGRGHWRLVFSTNAARRLLDLIRDYVPPCMAYKVPDARADYTGTHQRHDDVCLARVRSIAEVPLHHEATHVFDLEVKKNHNYIAGNIVVHNCSMMDGDQLTYLVRAIEEVNGRGYVLDRATEETPSDLGLTCVGDFAQLSPIKASYAFESPEWHHFAANTHTLTEIRRQADTEFIEALRAARVGDGLKALEYFGPRLVDTTDDHFDGPTILAKNEAVDRFNQLRFDKIAGPVGYFQSSRWGKQRSEWGNPEKPKGTWGIPDRLTMKVGALVMILNNVWMEDKLGRRSGRKVPLYVNGDLGEIIEMDEDQRKCVVRLQRTGLEVPVVYAHREVLVPCDSARRTELRNLGQEDRISDDGKWEITGAIDYMPLRLAYACTVHKSQGLSLDRVQVNIRDPFFKTVAMLYVALSRARTPDGLRLVGSAAAFVERCVADPRLKKFL